MLNIREQVSLRELNTFGIDAGCDYFTEITSIPDFKALTEDEVYAGNRRLVLGGGSNLLFRKDFKGIVVKNGLSGKEVLFQDDKQAIVRAAAGENWHLFVLWCIDQGFGGIENLSLIPGCVGAGPMQNIGAYGVELKEVFVELEAYDMQDAKPRKFSKADCQFGYRESVFKHECRDRYLIGSVTLRLSKTGETNTSYGAIKQELQSLNVKEPGIRDVSRAVMNIRRSKLPDPKEMGNAGSFFKNPEVNSGTFERLKKENPELVAYPLGNGNYKLAAGWLIEQCGLKGLEIDGAAVHTKQALVLVNKNNCTGDAVFRLSEYVLQTVSDKFGVMLEREVNIIQ